MSLISSNRRSIDRSSGLSFSQSQSSSFAESSSVPSYDRNKADWGRIENLTISNFKSYGGTTTVEFNNTFCAVIGPNGSGKSNLFDAISFVLGIKTQQLRGKKLTDLIHRSNFSKRDSSRQQRDDPDTAFVELTYNSKKLKKRDAEDADPDDDDDIDQDPEFDEETMTFRRTINRNGSTVNKVNGRTMSVREYEEELSKIGVIVRARNFLVFQGDVTGIASKTGKELTKWVFINIHSSLESEMTKLN